MNVVKKSKAKYSTIMSVYQQRTKLQHPRGAGIIEIFENKGSLKWPFRAIRVVFQHVLRAIYLLFVGITA